MKNINIIILIYDITNLESFEKLNDLKNLINIECTNKNIQKILIGNKIDLKKYRKVTYEKGKKFALKNGFEFLETSIKDCQSLYKAFDIINSSIENIINNTNSNKLDEEENKE